MPHKFHLAVADQVKISSRITFKIDRLSGRYFMVFEQTINFNYGLCGKLMKEGQTANDLQPILRGADGRIRPLRS
jgi:hypothetical protein